MKASVLAPTLLAVAFMALPALAADKAPTDNLKALGKYCSEGCAVVPQKVVDYIEARLTRDDEVIKDLSADNDAKDGIIKKLQAELKACT